MELIKTGKQPKTCVYRKTTNKGLLLHYQIHVDARYRRSLLMTMLNRAHCLSSSPDLFAEECDTLSWLDPVFLLDHLPSLILPFQNSSIRRSEWISCGNDVTIVLALNQILTHVRIFSRNALRYLYLGCSPSAERSFMKIDVRNFEILWNFYRKGLYFIYTNLLLLGCSLKVFTTDSLNKCLVHHIQTTRLK